MSSSSKKKPLHPKIPPLFSIAVSVFVVVLSGLTIQNRYSIQKFFAPKNIIPKITASLDTITIENITAYAQEIFPREASQSVEISSRTYVAPAPVPKPVPNPLSPVAQTPNTTSGTIIHIDPDHAYIGRLFNLTQVASFLNGKTMAPGQTLSYDSSIYLNQAASYFMMGRGYNGSGVLVPMLAGGVCGGSSALAGEVDSVGGGLVRSDDGARHLASDHAPGGIYWNLPNVAVFYNGYRYYDLRVTNTNPSITYKIQVSTNYSPIWDTLGINLSDWQASGDRWSEFLDPQALIGQNEFQVVFSIIPVE